MTPIQVDDGIWRGSQPQEQKDFATLASLGIKFILDLETGAAVFADGCPVEEAHKALTYEIETIFFPLGEFLPPTHEQLYQALKIIDSKKPIYIHCKTGVDRTGMVCAWYRMQIQKWSKRAAVEEMIRLGQHFWYRWWSWSL